MPIPLYGFLEGDTVGLLILASETETVADLAARLQHSARIRVAPRERVRVLYRGKPLALETTVEAAGLEPLERFDVVEEA